MDFSGAFTGWIFLIVSAGFFALGLYMAYLIIKAAVRNGTIEAYITLRREGLYPPREGRLANVTRFWLRWNRPDRDVVARLPVPIASVRA